GVAGLYNAGGRQLFDHAAAWENQLADHINQLNANAAANEMIGQILGQAIGTQLAKSDTTGPQTATIAFSISDVTDALLAADAKVGRAGEKFLEAFCGDQADLCRRMVKINQEQQAAGDKFLSEHPILAVINPPGAVATEGKVVLGSIHKKWLELTAKLEGASVEELKAALEANGEMMRDQITKNAQYERMMLDSLEGRESMDATYLAQSIKTEQRMEEFLNSGKAAYSNLQNIQRGIMLRIRMAGGSVGQ
ncbi:hypothetical protein, partial [Streptomyces wedmorensis]